MDKTFVLDLQKFISNVDIQEEERHTNSGIEYNGQEINVNVDLNIYKVSDGVRAKAVIKATVPEVCVRCLKESMVDKEIKAVWDIYNKDSKSIFVDIKEKVQEELYLQENYYPKCKNKCEISDN